MKLTELEKVQDLNAERTNVAQILADIEAGNEVELSSENVFRNIDLTVEGELQDMLKDALRKRLTGIEASLAHLGVVVDKPAIEPDEVEEAA